MKTRNILLMGPRHIGHACTKVEQPLHMERWPQGSMATSCGFAKHTTHAGLRLREACFWALEASMEELTSSEDIEIF